MSLIDQFAKKHNLPKYKIKQFNQAYYANAVASFDEIFTWAKDLRGKLKTEIGFTRLIHEKDLISKRGDTHKVLFKRKENGKRIETVLMRHNDGRNTVCVSCMVGCPVNCRFCATGKMGFQGNLSAHEIVDQVLFFQRILMKDKAKVTNVVFMGMGEPMLNLKEVEGSIEIMTNEDKIGMSKRRITISTSGYIPQFNQLVERGFRGRVAISLHAPNQELRAKLMPVAKQYSLDDLMEALDRYVGLTNKRVSYEYIMIKKVNDGEEHARQLVSLLRNRLAHVNLIPYNPIKEESYERSTNNQLHRFTEILTKAGVPYSIRVTMGDDVNAACGQLADRENEMYKKRLKRSKESIEK